MSAAVAHTGPVLEAVALVAGYRRRRRSVPIIGPVDLRVSPGELVCLAGPNGAGKSTLLRTMTGVQPALGGQLLLGGRPMRDCAPLERARHLALVSADRVDVALLRARDLVALGRYPHTGWGGRLDPSDWIAVDDAMARTGTAELADRDVSTLSDGERQRVMIARALAQQPDVIVLDEPTAFLDVNRRIELTALLRELTLETGTAVVLCSHDLELVLPCADVVWLVDDARAFFAGTMDELNNNGALRATFGPAVNWDGSRVVLQGPFARGAPNPDRDNDRARSLTP